MAYFRNTAVNLLNLHYAVHAIAQFGGGAFYYVFLLKAGVSLPGVLVFIAALLAGRFVIRPAIVPLAVRIGLRPTLIIGTLLCTIPYLLLGEVDGLGPALFVLCAASSVSDTFYWTTYHTYFAAIGDPHHRGQQLGVREAAVALTGIASPLATGWALVTFGPRAAFGAAAVFQVASMLPLLWTPDVKIAAHVPGGFRAALHGVALFFADAWTAIGYVVIWQLALFLSLGENFVAYGGALALAALVGAIGGLVLGRFIDSGHGTRAVWVATISLALLIVVRAAAPGHAALAVGANAVGALVTCLFVPTQMAAVYNLAKASPCPLRFHVATEGGWDAGGATACLIAALLISLNVPLSAAILLALAGVVASFILLRRYYSAETSPAPAASS